MFERKATRGPAGIYTVDLELRTRGHLTRQLDSNLGSYIGSAFNVMEGKSKAAT